MMKHLEYYRKKNEDEFGNPLKMKSDKKDKSGDGDEDQEYSSDESFDKQLLEEIKEVQWHFKKNLIDPKNMGARDKSKQIEVENFESAKQMSQAEALAKLMQETCENLE